MTQRMTFTLDGRDDLSRTLNGAGDSAARLHQRLDDAAARSSTSLRNLARDADGRLRFASGAIVRAAGDAGDALNTLADDADDAARRIADDADDIDDSLDDIADSADQAGDAVQRSLRDRMTDAAEKARDKIDKLSRSATRFAAFAAGGLAAPAAVAGVGMLAATLVSAGAAAGAFKLAVAPQMDAVTKATEAYTAAQEAQAEGGEAAAEAQKKYKAELAKLPPATRAMAKELIGLKGDHKKWSDQLAKDTMPVFTKGLQIARTLLPKLTPLVKTAANAFGDFLDGIGKKAAGGGFDRAIARIDRAAKETLPDLLRSGKNVFVGLGGIIDAFLPSEGKLSTGIENATKKFADWGQGLKNSEGFEKFMRLAGQSADALGRLATAVGDILTDLGPFAGLALEGAAGLAKLISKAPPEVLQGIAAGLLAMKLATIGLNAALALMSMNPVTLAALAVVALGTAFVVAWQKSQRFREIASSALMGFVQVGLAQIRLILMGLQAFTQTAIQSGVSVAEGMAGMFGWVPGFGPKLKQAAKAAEGFKDDSVAFFDEAIGSVDAYSNAADQMPKAIRLQGDITNLDDKITKAQAKVDSLKQKRKTAVGADKSRLDDSITRAQAKVDSLKQKRAAKVAALDRASAVISGVQGKLNALDGKTANTYVNTFYSYKGKNIAGVSAGRLASGGLVGRDGLPGYPGGGLIKGIGTPTSDSNLIWASRDEYMVKAASVRRYGIPFMDALNAGRIPMGGFGGASSAGASAAQGLAGGMRGGESLVSAAARRMAAAVTAGIRAELQIASPSKRTTALAKDIGVGLVKGLTGSRDKIKATAKDLAADIWRAFDGSKDNRLVGMVNRNTAKLLDAAKKRDALAATIKRANEFAESSRVKAKQSASLSSLFGGDEEKVTAGGILGRLNARLAKMKQFGRYISDLAKRGLNKTMLREILELGPEEGYAYANALAGADKATLGAINRTQFAINDQAKRLGRGGADALYDSGKNSAKGFLSGLKSQQKAIEDFMVKIAKGMQKALRAALGIKSPSTVLARIGVHSTEGLARGLVDGLPVLDRALGAVSARVAGTRPVIGRPAVAGAGSGVTIINNVTVEEAMDPVAVGRAVQRVLRQYKRGGGDADLGI